MRPGEWVAISGAGGLGHLAIQYAKAMGLHVAALDVATDKLALAKAMGAEVAVDARSLDAAAEIMKATGGGRTAYWSRPERCGQAHNWPGPAACARQG